MFVKRGADFEGKSMSEKVVSYLLKLFCKERVSYLQKLPPYKKKKKKEIYKVQNIHKHICCAVKYKLMAIKISVWTFSSFLIHRKQKAALHLSLHLLIEVCKLLFEDISH